MDENKKWYVIYVQGGSRSIIQIQSMIDRLGFANTMLWSPSKKETVSKYGKLQLSNRPLFSSYIFLNTDEIVDSRLEQALIENKLGRFLKLPHDEHNDLPTSISQEDIDHLKSLEERDVEPIPQELLDIEVGNIVEVCVGPWMGTKGIVTQVKGHEVFVETLVFGRSVPVQLNAAHVSKITETGHEEASQN